MKRIWNNIKTFFGNLKKMYRLAQRVSFYDNTIRFEGSIETTRHMKAGHNVYVYQQYFPQENNKAEQDYEVMLKQEEKKGN